MDSYWSSILQARTSRRKTLVGAGSAGLGAAFLAACGGGGAKGKSSAPKDTSGLLSTPIDSSKQAVKGGTWVNTVAADPPHFDPLLNSVGAGQVGYHAYPHIFNYKVGTPSELPDGGVDGDVVNAWETSPDGLKVTMKLRPNVKLDPRPPTNGRNLTVDDIRWSMAHWAAVGPSAKDLLNAQNPNAPIKNVSYPDANTIAIDLAFPYPAIFRALGFLNWFYVLPSEAEDKFNPRSETRGSGPWMLTEFQPSVHYKFSRNPNWWKGPDRPYLDAIDYAVIPDVTTRNAEFAAGKIWGPLATGNSQVLPIKRQSPQLMMTAVSPFTGQQSMSIVALSKLPSDPINKDVRIRHAISMLIDRDAFIDTVYNVSGLQKEGLPIEAGWNGHVPCSWPNEWLDPKTNKLGEASKYFQYKPDEAAALLKAAGFYGSEVTMHSDTRPASAQNNSLFQSMFQGTGHLKVKLDLRDYNSDYLPNYVFNQGKFDGISTQHTYGAWPDLDFPLFVLYDKNGRNAMVTEPLPQIQDIMNSYRREADPKKRIDLAHQWQIAMANEMPTIPHPGLATVFRLTWPWLGNANYFQLLSLYNVNQEEAPLLWYDKSKGTAPS